MSRAPEKHGLAALMARSTVDKLNHVAAVLSAGGGGVGYDAISGWMAAHPGKVCPVDYVVLFAEAAVAGVPTERVERAHPRAASMAQYLVSHMERSRPDIMGKLPFTFGAPRARP